MAALDRREAILARLLAIFETMVGAGDTDFRSAHRNRAGIEGLPDTKILLLDGDETVRLSTYGHANRTPPHNLMTLLPEIWVVQEPKENVKNANIGPEYSAWRVKVLRAVMSDAQLLDLLGGESGQIEYTGFETDLKNENQMLGQMRLDIALTYVLDPDEL